MAKKYFFTLPKPIQLRNPETDEALRQVVNGAEVEVEPISFLTFVRRGLLHDRRWMADADALTVAGDFVRGIRAAMAGDGVVEVDGDDFEKVVKPIAHKPEGGYGLYQQAAEVLHQLLPHVRAITNATTSRPAIAVEVPVPAPAGNGAIAPSSATA